MKPEIKNELEQFLHWYNTQTEYINCSKNFLPVEIVEKYIDYKLNNKLKHYVRFYFAGSMFAESTVMELTENDFDIPKYAFAFDFYDMYDGIELNTSHKTYIGDVLTIQDIEEMNIKEKKYDILLSNMRSNGWYEVVKTIIGNVQPFEEGDKCISSIIYFREEKLKRILKLTE